MKKRKMNGGRLVGYVLVFLIVFQACQNEGDKGQGLTQANEQQSAQAAEDNSQMIGTMQDVADVTANAFSSNGISSGRVADDTQISYECGPIISSDVKVDKSRPDSLIYSGTITIDYGNGTGCSDSVHMKKGKIIDTFLLVFSFKDSVTFNSSEKITFDGFSRDSVALDGSITLTASSGQPTTIHVDEVKSKYVDGTLTSWTGDLVFTLHYRSGCRRWLGGVIDVTGAWSGVTRNGTSYSANITNAVEFKSGCVTDSHKVIAGFIPVVGTIDVTANSVASTVDFGDGTCDRIFTITTAGVTKEYTYRCKRCSPVEVKLKIG